MIDEDGFQQVRYRKNMRMNIFDLVDDSLRENAFVQREEGGITPSRYMQHQRRSNQDTSNQGDKDEGQ